MAKGSNPAPPKGIKKPTPPPAPPAITQATISPLVLTAQLASKIASVVVHADELLSPDGRNVDKTALEVTLADPELREWIKQLGPLAPLKRR